MVLNSFNELFFNPVAQVKIVYTVGADYVTASIFVLAVSTYYILKSIDRIEFLLLRQTSFRPEALVSENPFFQTNWIRITR